jgi:hypothetical protein
MKGSGEIRQKLKQAQYRHLKRLLRKRLPTDEDWDRNDVQGIKKELREFFSAAPLHEIAQRFPDVAALLWVLAERDDEDLIPEGTLVGSLDGVFLWADTAEKADRARDVLDTLIEKTSENGIPKKSWWKELFR